MTRLQDNDWNTRIHFCYEKRNHDTHAQNKWKWKELTTEYKELKANRNKVVLGVEDNSGR